MALTPSEARVWTEKRKRRVQTRPRMSLRLLSRMSSAEMLVRMMPLAAMNLRAARFGQDSDQYEPNRPTDIEVLGALDAHARSGVPSAERLGRHDLQQAEEVDAVGQVGREVGHGLEAVALQPRVEPIHVSWQPQT